MEQNKLIKLLWLDHNVMSSENQKIYNNYSNKIEFIRFSEEDKAIHHLQTYSENIIVLTNGRAKEFIEKITNFQNVSIIIIFTSIEGKKYIQKGWAGQCKKIFAIIDDEFSNILKQIDSYFYIKEQLDNIYSSKKQNIIIDENELLQDLKTNLNSKISFNKSKSLFQNLMCIINLHRITLNSDLEKLNKNVFKILEACFLLFKDQNEQKVNPIKLYCLVDANKSFQQKREYLLNFMKAVDTKEAANNMTEDKKYSILEVELSKNNPHPYVKAPDSSNQYIIFPFMPIEIISNLPTENIIAIQNQSPPISISFIQYLKQFLNIEYLRLLSTLYRDSPITANEILSLLIELYPTEKSSQVQKRFDIQLNNKVENLLKATAYELSIYYITNDMTKINDNNINILKLSAVYYNLYHLSTDIIKHDNTKKLYFGISANKKSIFWNNFRFWKDFIWTYTDIEEAKDIAGINGIIFEIELSQDDPHPNWKSGFLWSISNNDNQVWLFPYFAFEFISKTQIDDYSLIKIRQDSKQSILSISKEKTEENLKILLKEAILHSIIS